MLFYALTEIVMRVHMKLFIIAVLLLSTKVAALERSHDDQLSFILSTYEVLYESKDFPITVKVIQTWEEISECDGLYDSCPNARLYISSSVGDLYEKPHLYQLPIAKGWKVTSSKVTEHFLFIGVNTTLEHANVSLVSRRRWKSTFYEVKISRYDGSVSLVTR